MQAISKFNSNYRYILVVIDTFSKHACSYPLKRKTEDEVCDAFKIFLAKGRVPKNLQTDLGTEFYNSKFKQLVQKNAINHYSTYSVKKASITEIFIRTLKSKMYKQFSLKGNYKWMDGTLESSILSYNNTVHRTINQKPDKVNNTNKRYILERYFRPILSKLIIKNNF